MTQIVVRLREIRIQEQRASEARDRLIEFPKPSQCITQVVVHHGIIGQQLSSHLRGVQGVPPMPGQGQPEHLPDNGGIRVLFENFREPCFPLPCSALP